MQQEVLSQVKRGDSHESPYWREALQVHTLWERFQPGPLCEKTPPDPPEEVPPTNRAA